MNLSVLLSELNFKMPTRLALCLLANLFSKMLVDGESLQDVSCGCIAADSVSMQAVYGPAGPVVSGFTKQREGTAAATNTETLPIHDNCTAAHKRTMLCVWKDSRHATPNGAD